MTDNGNAAQTRAIVEQAGNAAAELAISKFAAQHPEMRKPEVPAPLKWAGGITAALFTMGVGAMAVWLITTVNEIQLTVARMDERLGGQSASQNDRYTDHERRLQRLETERQEGKQ